ncbi:MAG: hypothetical protein KME32_18570 [Mojavia pulchra JT2-VF2]|jgi:hypothetical protein|uniref:Uncharacterized protein n=1 Tax=Mojavia pulchra JT2-VF2 TaxID=287848 RepID=A0A951Q0N7_9NOST|nr:hypothetical protein [Mojavia pulchra JT2-VF2]
MRHHLKGDRSQSPHFSLWIVSLLLNLAFWLLLRLLPAEATYTLRGFWSVLFLPCLGLLTLVISWWAIKKLPTTSLSQCWQRLICLLHFFSLLFLWLYLMGFLLGILAGFISPDLMTEYVSPSGQRSITIVRQGVTIRFISIAFL